MIFSTFCGVSIYSIDWLTADSMNTVDAAHTDVLLSLSAADFAKHSLIATEAERV